MATKTFKTSFEIDAKFKGQGGFNKLYTNLDKVGRKVKNATASFGKMFGAVVAGINSSVLAWKAFDAIVDIGKASYDAAKDVKKAYDTVAQANARLVEEGRLNSKNLQKQTDDTIKLAETLSKSGLDAETLAVGMAGLTRSFSSKQIEAMSKGWMDWMVTIHKGAPTMEQAQEDALKLQMFVEKGNARGLQGLGITKERIAAIAEETKDMSEQQAIEYRGAQIAKILGKETGALAAWRETDAGKAYDAAQAQEALLETMGKPMVESMRELNIAMTEMYKALQPVADLIAGYLKQGLADFAKWITDNKVEIKAFVEAAVIFFKNRLDELITSLQDTYRQAKATWEFIIQVIDDNKKAWKIFTDSFHTDGAAAWEKLKAIWNAIPTWFDTNVVKPISAYWDWLIGNSYLVEGAERGWEEIKKVWNKISGWFYDNVIKPIADQWDKLWKKGGPPGAFLGGGGGFGGRGASGSWGGGGGGTTSAGGGEVGSTEPNAAIEAERAAVMKQLDDPEVKKLVAATIAQEQGSAGGRADVLESLVNRSVVTGKSLRQLITGGGRKGSFYGPYRRGEVQAALARGMSPAAMEEFDKMAEEVRKGRNRIRGRTDQGMANEVHGSIIKSAGEYYGEMGYKGEKQTAAWRAGQGLAEGPTKKLAEQQQTKMIKENKPASWPGGIRDAQGNPLPSSTEPVGPGLSTMPAGASLKRLLRGMSMKQRTEGATPTNLAMNPTINVNGVAAGSENLMAEKINRVVQDNSKELIAQLKQARSYESRLGYV